MTKEAEAAADTRTSLLRERPFLILFGTRAAANTSSQMLAVAAGWKIYELTDSALLLGMVGLVQFVPPLCLTLVAGHAADYRDRRKILAIAFSIEFCGAIGLFMLAGMSHPPLAVFYALLFMNASANTFEGPSLQSMLPALVPRQLLSRAVAANSMGGRFAMLLGPAAGGFLYALGAQADFLACALLLLSAGAISLLLPRLPASFKAGRANWRDLFSGLSFIWRTKPMLGAMSLDVTATLFGSVTALLPIFANEYLHIGPAGFGLLRSAPAFGGFLTALLLSRFPLGRRGGWFIFIGMGVYGVCTILFAFSHFASLSFLLLFVVGMGDMLSGVTRQTLIQVLAPDDTRGRVLAVNSLFNSTAGQLGMFESGLAAAAVGVQGSVVLGGVVVLAVTALWIRCFPALHRMDWKAQIMNDGKRGPAS